MKPRKYRTNAATLFGMLVLAVVLVYGCGGPKPVSLPPEATGTVSLSLNEHWNLTRPGNAVTVHDDQLGRSLIVVCTQDSTWRAFDSWCTHQGCEVSPAIYGSGLECPCHVSKFSLTGEVMDGPAPRPLVEYAVQTRNDSLFITLNNRKVR